MENPDIIHANKNESGKAPAAKLKKKSEELEKHIIFLSRKNKGKKVPVTEVQFYGFSPDELAKKLNQNGEDIYEWCITRRKQISERSINKCRKAGDGTWEQKHTTISIKLDGKEIGYRRYYVFKRGSDHKTDWRLHEYEEVINTQGKSPEDKLKKDYVLCKLYKKSKGGSNKINGKRKGSSSTSNQHKKEKPANHNHGSISQTSKFPARLGIAGASDNTVPEFKSIRAVEDYNALPENLRQIIKTDEWMNDQALVDEFNRVVNCFLNE